MDTLFWWVGAIVTVSGGALLAAAAALVAASVLAQVLRAFWVARRYRPCLRPACDNAVFRALDRLRFVVRILISGLPSRITSNTGLVMWSDTWLDEPSAFFTNSPADRGEAK